MVDDQPEYCRYRYLQSSWIVSHNALYQRKAVFAVLVLVPGMVGWGLLKRHEFARIVAVVLFTSLGLLVAVLGLVYVGLSIRIYRALLLAGIFCLLAGYLRRDLVRSQFARKDIQRLSLS